MLSSDEPGVRDGLNPGIHAIVSLDEPLHPSTFELNSNEKNSSRSKPSSGEVHIVLFYWPVDDAFKTDEISRSNVSCLYLRTLHELCDCVLIESSMKEVKHHFNLWWHAGVG